tara:strand:+ start:3650 stop:3838 length:189 start_codon:yes stop_codon:yes gene_type:complete
MSTQYQLTLTALKDRCKELEDSLKLYDEFLEFIYYGFLDGDVGTMGELAEFVIENKIIDEEE